MSDLNLKRESLDSMAEMLIRARSITHSLYNEMKNDCPKGEKCKCLSKGFEWSLDLISAFEMEVKKQKILVWD